MMSKLPCQRLDPLHLAGALDVELPDTPEQQQQRDGRDEDVRVHDADKNPAPGETAQRGGCLF